MTTNSTASTKSSAASVPPSAAPLTPEQIEALRDFWNKVDVAFYDLSDDGLDSFSPGPAYENSDMIDALQRIGYQHDLIKEALDAYDAEGADFVDSTGADLESMRGN